MVEWRLRHSDGLGEYDSPMKVPLVVPMTHSFVPGYEPGSQFGGFVGGPLKNILSLAASLKARSYSEIEGCRVWEKPNIIYTPTLCPEEP